MRGYETALGAADVWKGLACGLAAPILSGILGTWLAVPLSWGIAVFLSFMVYHEASPRAGSRRIIVPVLASAGAALVAGAEAICGRSLTSIEPLHRESGDRHGLR